MKIIKGITTFTIANASYKIIMIESVLSYKLLPKLTKTTIPSRKYYNFCKHYKIKYVINNCYINPIYESVDYEQEESLKTTRQQIKNELRYKKFNDSFENLLKEENS